MAGLRVDHIAVFRRVVGKKNLVYRQLGVGGAVDGADIVDTAFVGAGVVDGNAQGLGGREPVILMLV